MGEFFVGIITVSLVISILNFISFKSKGDKTTRAAMGIILTWVVAVSAFSGLSRLRDVDFDSLTNVEIGQIYGDEYKKEAEKAFSEGIKRLLLEKYGIKKEESEVVLLNFDFETMRAEKINITLLGKGAISDFRSIENYVEQMELGECEVKIRID